MKVYQGRGVWTVFYNTKKNCELFLSGKRTRIGAFYFKYTSIFIFLSDPGPLFITHFAVFSYLEVKFIEIIYAHIHIF